MSLFAQLLAGVFEQVSVLRPGHLVLSWPLAAGGGSCLNDRGRVFVACCFVVAQIQECMVAGGEH